MNIRRVWAMPNADTFSIPPIGDFVKTYLVKSTLSIDPFARNKRWATHTNDLNADTCAENHMDAVDFMAKLCNDGVKADLVLFDPPYSPRQISECYKSVGREVGMETTQSSFWSKIKASILPVLKPGAIVLSFGWNSTGMGRVLGFEILEILLVCHGGAHNDTICVAERLIEKPQTLPLDFQ